MARMLWLTTGVIALLAYGPACAADPVGTWLIPDGTAKVRIVVCGENMCGNVVWLSQPNDAATGMPQTDKLNANPQKRSRPILGVAVILGMQRMNEDSKWSGPIYNPDDGETYAGKIELMDQARLKIEVCVSMFCHAEIWTRSK